MSRPFEEARWDLVPGRTVLVCIDLQNDFLHPQGWYASRGIDIAHMRRVVEPTRQLLADARAKNVPVVWTRHGTRGVEDAGPFFRLRPFLRDGGLRLGTWGFGILDDLEPREEDWYVEQVPAERLLQQQPGGGSCGPSMPRRSSSRAC